ncbi:uncharacterized protein LOC128993924 [Macrosteles quadrilineatus]|uniref:uncharacterized protein LOC128993924 n=1 Tax=Macrosteles quadrilineatus TaxID=74068 RepID=UPI0023E0D0AC|nr:uncharacterized protein LOC128993924 [Macrosteles quadrilineatus]
MVARSLWLWLCIGWLTEAVLNPSSTTICDLGPCRCVRGKLLCDCSTSKIKEIYLKDLDEESFSSISVTNCTHVHLASRTLSRLPALQQVTIADIDHLTLEEHAFSWVTDNPSHTGLMVNLTNCFIPEVPSYSFKGSIRDIVLSSVNISRVSAYAFAAIEHAEKIEFERVSVADFESQSFKKFSVNFFTWSDSVFNVLPTRLMIDVEVNQEVKFDNVVIDTAKYLSLKIHGPRNFRLLKSLVRHVEHQALHIHTRGPVTIMDNVFTHVEKGGFVGFTVERRFLQEAGKQDFIFENNTLVDFESAPLIFNTTGFTPRLDWIVVDQQCSCQNADYWTSDLVYFSSDPRVSTAVPQVENVIYCHNLERATNVKDFRRLFCNIKDSNILLTLAFISGSVISLSVILMLAYLGFKEKAKRYMNVPNSPSPVKQSNKNHMLVIPDGKTYRETELHVIVEHVEPIVPTEYVRAPPEA